MMKMFMKSTFLCLILLSKVFAEEYEKARAVPTSGPTPTINESSPDLDIPMQYYKCVSIKGSRPCEGMDDFYVPETGLFSDLIGFNKYVSSEVNNDSGILKALCPQNTNVKHDLKKVAYRYSMFCGRMLYSQARWCPQNSDQVRANPKLSLCKATCIEYAKSIADYGQTVCGNADNSVGEKIKENIINKWCNLFTDDPGCSVGTKKESAQCGYSSASYAVEAEQFNPHNKCWDKGEGEANAQVLDQLREMATKEQTEKHEMGKIRWKIIYPISTVVIIGAITAFFWVKQNKKYKLGYIPGNSSKMNDYEFVPSNAKPSREYVDDDFIDKFELEIPKATLTRSGSLSVKKLNRAQAKPKDKKYMIAIYNYHPQKEDELELRSGDRVRVEHEYEDGWGAGINETTNKFGAFPLICCSTNISNNEESLPKRSRSRVTASSNAKRRSSNPPVPPLPAVPVPPATSTSLPSSPLAKTHTS